MYVYVLKNQRKRTYVGYTMDLKKRLRQHNGEIKGGAKSTRGRGPWKFAIVISAVGWTKEEAMSFEWHVKRFRKGRGLKGVEASLAIATSLPKFGHLDIECNKLC
jgi:predicted GIY-YIG superfamily endonuclease